MSGLYFSKRLEEKCKDFYKKSLVLVEAPGGYGKTTVVNHILEKVPKNRVHYFTAIRDVKSDSYYWLVNKLLEEGVKEAEQLKTLGPLNRSNAKKIGELLGSIKLETPLFLVMDNFQFVIDEWEVQVFVELTRDSASGIHIILVSQDFKKMTQVFYELRQSLCYIKAKDLLLTVGETEELFLQNNIKLGTEQIRVIHNNTMGWTIGVIFYIENIRAELPIQQQDVNTLLHYLFWNKLTRVQQETLLHLCFYECVNPRVLKTFLPTEYSDLERVQELLKRVPLIRYVEEGERFFLHDILLVFLQDKLKQEDSSFIEQVYRTVGDFHKAEGRIKEAISFYYSMGLYGEIVKCNLSGLLMEEFAGVSYTKLALQVLQNCPLEIQKEYPLGVLQLCYGLYAGCDFANYTHFIQKSYEYCKEDPDVLGEWYLVAAFLEFPNIDKMYDYYENAKKLLRESSEIFTQEEPFMFGCTSMWFLFYREIGKMFETTKKLEKLYGLYNTLTNNHGAGAVQLYQGEVYSVQGRFEESLIQIYQASQFAEKSNNVSVIYGVALLMGINAIYQGDMLGLQKAIEYLENKANSSPILRGKAIKKCMVESVRGYLLGILMEPGKSVDWARGEADHFADLTFANFMVKNCRITDLILNKKYHLAIASVEACMQLDERLISLPTKNFIYAGLALCYLAIGRVFKATEYLDMSLTITKSDKNYTFLACYKKYFNVLFLHPLMTQRHGAAIHEIRNLKLTYKQPEITKIFAMLEEENAEGLTKREQEIAHLAAAGMRNSEIACSLKISENTVKYHMKAIFLKLNIDRRSNLVELLK